MWGVFSATAVPATHDDPYPHPFTPNPQVEYYRQGKLDQAEKIFKDSISDGERGRDGVGEERRPLAGIVTSGN